MSIENLSNDNLRQLSNDSQPAVRKPSIDEVDQLADELAEEFNNPGWRSWYCGYINRYGIEQVVLWRDKARMGNSPARLFSTYLKQARKRGAPEVEHVNTPVTSITSEQLPSSKSDTVYIPVGDLTQAEVDRIVSEGIDDFIRTESPEPAKAIPWMNDD